MEPVMKTYRITYQVTTDVHETDEGRAVFQGLQRLQEAVGDDGSPGRSMWITGVAREVVTGEYHIYARDYSEADTVAEEPF